MLAELGTRMSIDVMPGEKDPANYLLPQQPLFRGLFPVASTLSTLSMETNPYAVTVNGVRCGSPGRDSGHHHCSLTFQRSACGSF